MHEGSIRYHLEKLEKFEEIHVKFYCAQIVSAISFLHLNHSITL